MENFKKNIGQLQHLFKKAEEILKSQIFQIGKFGPLTHYPQGTVPLILPHARALEHLMAADKELMELFPNCYTMYREVQEAYEKEMSKISSQIEIFESEHAKVENDEQPEDLSRIAESDQEKFKE